MWHMKILKNCVFVITSALWCNGAFPCSAADKIEPAAPHVSGGSSELISLQVASGVLAENADSNLTLAIKSYQKAIEEFDAGRKPAALAIFQLGAAYLKQGKTVEASQLFERLSREFPDLAELTARSNAALTSALKKQPKSGTENIPDRVAAEDPKLMANSLLLMKEQMLILKKQVEEGNGTREELS